MVMLNEAFPGNWLKSADLQGREVPVVIASADIETVGKDRKLCLFFRGKTKGMICNKTNAQRIGLAYGEDTDAWVGQSIILYSEMVDFQGKATWGLRVKVPRQVSTQFVAAREHVQQHLAGNGKPVAYSPPTTQFDERNPPPHTGGGPLPDDDIPFSACKD